MHVGPLQAAATKQQAGHGVDEAEEEGGEDEEMAEASGEEGDEDKQPAAAAELDASELPLVVVKLEVSTGCTNAATSAALQRITLPKL